MQSREIAWMMVRTSFGQFIGALLHFCTVIACELVYESRIAMLLRRTCDSCRYHRKMIFAGCFGLLAGTNIGTLAILAATVA